MGTGVWRRALGMLLAVALVQGLPGGAAPAEADGVGAGGPALESDPVALETALSCPEGLNRVDRPVVLLVHGTATTAQESWPLGMGVALSRAGFDWCTVQLPGRALVDIQTSTEYVVAAVRAIHGRTGGRVSMIGHSQGALQVRWALRWWPDVRAVVDDAITAAGANRTIPWTQPAFCSAGKCAPPIWQFSTGAAFMEVLNRVPVPEGPAYTAIYSLTDDLIQPSVPASSAVATIDGAANVLIQDLCPGRYVGHGGLIFDAAFAATVLDTLTHPGPADAARVDRGSCARAHPDGVDSAAANIANATLYANAFAAVAAGPKTDREPPLRPYAR